MAAPHISPPISPTPSRPCASACWRRARRGTRSPPALALTQHVLREAAAAAGRGGVRLLADRAGDRHPPAAAGAARARAHDRPAGHAEARQPAELSACGARATCWSRNGSARSARSANRRCPDFLLVPLLAFDRRGHRLGYGAGFYDRTLAGLPGTLCARASPMRRRRCRRCRPAHGCGAGRGGDGYVA